MRVTYDGRRDVAYVYLTSFHDADVARSHYLGEHDIQGDFKFEFDKTGCLLGFEVEFASGAIPKEVLDTAERV